MNYYVLTPGGWTYLNNQKQIPRYYKKILAEVIIPENEFKLFSEDFLLINNLVIKAEEKELGKFAKYKKFIRKENPVNSIREIKFELTSRCNLKCPHCYLTGNTENESLDIKMIKDIILSLIHI